MNKIFDNLSDEDKEKLKKSAQPDWTSPMLATLTKEHFSKEGWIFERKFDGQRCLVFQKGKTVKLMSRNKKEINRQYPEIVEAFENQKHTFIADGEIVAFDGNVTSFRKLQPRMHSKNPDRSVKVFFYVFDLLFLEGYDLSKLDLRSRKSLLKEALIYDSDILRFTPHRNTKGKEFLKEACKNGWEGLIAKDAGSNYIHSRSKSWLKFKCEKRQELIICGYTAPGGSRKYFGALIIGYYDDGKLKNAGKVGTGYDDKTLELVYGKMKPLEQDNPPFDNKKTGYKNATWLKPKLVGEFRFSEWTADNKLRHPSFLGLREDKKAKEVTKEEPKS
ncbi:MAG: non-homologous end-joining DNA ligase [Prolixibacteraceae bacterium]